MIRRRDGKEEGSALVETAIVLSLLMILAIGAFEWGMAFRDWFERLVCHQGRRSSCSVSRQDPRCRLCDFGGDSRIVAVHRQQQNRVRRTSTTPTSMAIPQVRCRPTSPLSPTRTILRIFAASAGSPSTTPPIPRLPGTTSEQNDDWVGVRLEFTHTWKTGLFWWSGGVTWSDRTIILMEPDPTI